MPEMNGYDTVLRIREWERNSGRPTVPIIALTANAFESDRRKAFEVGMNDFLTKPVIVDELRSALARWLANSDESPKDAIPITAQREVNVERVRSIVTELLPLLSDNRFDAVRRFRDLQRELYGSPVADNVAAIGTDVDRLNFAEVLMRLRELSKQEGWDEPV
jgi:DNA-binding response OmpR family regulator